MPTMMEGEGENGPSNCSWEVYLGAEAFCWYRYALIFRPSTRMLGMHFAADGENVLAECVSTRVIATAKGESIHLT